MRDVLGRTRRSGDGGGVEGYLLAHGLEPDGASSPSAAPSSPDRARDEFRATGRSVAARPRGGARFGRSRSEHTDPSPPRRSSIVVVVGSPIAPADLPTLCAGVRARVERSAAEVVVIDLGAVGTPTR